MVLPNRSERRCSSPKGLIEQLFREDSTMIIDGTWMPPQTESAQMASLRRTLAALPADSHAVDQN